MKISYLLNVLLLCLAGLPVSDARLHLCERREPQQTNIQARLPLHLTMKIVGQTYCTGDAELDGVRMDALLNFTNIGKQQLILYKGSNLVSQIRVSRNLQDIAAKRFELNSSLTNITTQRDLNDFTESFPGKDFVVLPPGASYEVKSVVGVFAVRGDARQITGALLSGEHFLQVEVSTWNGSDELVKELRRRWQDYGLLWYEPVISAPVPFTIDKQRQIVDCP
jgi:hypothetical protein